jgi:hypothetical protein
MQKLEERPIEERVVDQLVEETGIEKSPSNSA